VVVAAGGGGVPVVSVGGVLRGVDAVIDKDLAAERLASALGADALLLVTGVPQVMLDYGKATARSVAEMTVDEALRHAEDGQFPEGSMGPKIRAATRFVGTTGGVAVVTDAAHAVAALVPPADGAAEYPGTRIVSAPTSLGAAS
jgi:carbamate kinase